MFSAVGRDQKGAFWGLTCWPTKDLDELIGTYTFNAQVLYVQDVLA